MCLKYFDDLVDDFKKFKLNNKDSNSILGKITVLRKNKTQVLDEFEEYFDDMLEIIEGFVKNDKKFF